MGLFGKGGEGQMMQQQPDEIPSETYDVTYGGISKEQSTEQVKFLLTSDDVLQDLEVYLRGMKWDDKKSAYVKDKNVKPMINDRGVDEIILRVIKLRSSRIFTLSNFTDKQIYMICKQFGRNIAIELYANYKQYEINRLDIRLVTHELVDAVFASMLKARNSQLQNFLKDTTKVTETRNLQRPNALSKLNIFK